MELPVIYKYSKNGKPQQWQIIVEGNSYYTIEGLVGGTLTTSLPTIVQPKSIGRANETTGEGQAAKEAKAKHQKQLDNHYNEVLTTERKFFAPMLLKNLGDYEHKLFTTRTFIQPKADGLRAISQDGLLTSRKGKPYVTCPHLHQKITILDGELYNHELKDDFNEIMSLLTTDVNVTEELIRKTSEIVQLWIFDFPAHKGVFSERRKALKNFILGYQHYAYKVVPTWEVFNRQQMDEKYNQFLDEGFEGAVVRLDSGVYVNDRDFQVLRMKERQEDEFEFKDFIEGKGNRIGTAGAAMCLLKDGREVKAGVNGTFEHCAKLWKERTSYVGKMATIEFANYTPGGSLRQAKFIRIRTDL